MLILTLFSSFRPSLEIHAHAEAFPSQSFPLKNKKVSNVAFSSSSKSPSPLQPYSQASQSSAETNFQSPPSYGDAISAAAVSSKKMVRGSELSKYDKQRQHVDYNFQQGNPRPQQQQPISYLQVSSGSSQSTSTDPHNFIPEYGLNSGTTQQQRYKRKKNQPYPREQVSSGSQSSGQRGQILRYI